MRLLLPPNLDPPAPLLLVTRLGAVGAVAPAPVVPAVAPAPVPPLYIRFKRKRHKTVKLLIFDKDAIITYFHPKSHPSATTLAP